MSPFLALVAAASLAPQDPGPAGFTAVMACRTIAEAEARLACFDRAAAALDEAQRSGQIAVVDRAEVQRTRRESFGFNLPSLGNVFGAASGPEIEEIETTLESARQAGGAGPWVFRLADGTVWRQIDSASTYFPNREGQPVRVRRGAVGSYLLTIGSGRAFRVRRE